MPITKATPLEDIIDDFVNSTAPQFKGKSKEERIRMAKGAYYGMQKESVELLSAIMEEDTLQSSQVFRQILQNKIVELIGERRIEVAENIFGTTKPIGTNESILPGHPYHNKTTAELEYIQKDAREAARNMKGHDPKAEAKYLDQVNDATTILHHRRKFGSNQG